jgi:hypothetical protein
MARVSLAARSRTAVQESDAENRQPIYAAALLKLVLRMRRAHAPTLPDWDSLVDQALGSSRDVHLDRPAFRAYLERNYSFLLAALRQKSS